MPTFNGANFIGHALESVARQHDDAIEIIAVDDGSTDATRAILASYARRLAMRVIARRHSGNWVESTVIGMSVAHGRYLCWLHQDDLWRPSRLAKLRRLAERHPKAAFFVHPSWYIDALGRRIGYWHCPLSHVNRQLGCAEVLSRLLVQCFIASPATLFSAEAVQLVGLPDATLTYSADWEYWLRLARLGASLYHPTPLACFRIHEASQTLARVDQADERRAQQMAVLARHLPGLEDCGQCAEQVGRVARFSIQLNHALTNSVAGRPVQWRSLAAEFAKLGVDGWYRMFRDSRIIERCLSRAQAVGMRAATVPTYAHHKIAEASVAARLPWD